MHRTWRPQRLLKRQRVSDREIVKGLLETEVLPQGRQSGAVCQDVANRQAILPSSTELRPHVSYPSVERPHGSTLDQHRDHHGRKTLGAREDQGERVASESAPGVGIGHAAPDVHHRLPAYPDRQGRAAAAVRGDGAPECVYNRAEPDGRTWLILCHTADSVPTIVQMGPDLATHSTRMLAPRERDGRRHPGDPRQHLVSRVGMSIVETSNSSRSCAGLALRKKRVGGRGQ